MNGYEPEVNPERDTAYFTPITADLLGKSFLYVTSRGEEQDREAGGRRKAVLSEADHAPPRLTERDIRNG